MKKILLLSSVLALSACGVKTQKATQLVDSSAKTSIQTFSHSMSLTSVNTQFTHVATFQPSSFNNKKLQATSVTKSGNLLYITYNTQFDDVRGGIDIISLSSTNVPTVLKSLVSENTEYADAKLSGNFLYMVGQKKVADRNYAVLTVLDISNSANPVVVSEKTFNGFYATSIDLQSNKAYITVPNLGVVSVDVSTPASLTVLNTTSITAGNSLYVKRAGLASVVIGGSSNHNLSVVSPSQNSVVALAGRSQEAPARFTYKDAFLYTNAGNTGLRILKDFETTTPTMSYTGSLSGTGNGLSLGACDKLYLAQGEQGLQVYNVANKQAPVNEGSFDFANDSGSANNTFYVVNNNEHFVFVADGLAGIQMVKVNPTCATAHDEDDEDKDHENSCEHDKGLTCKIYDLTATKPSALPDFSTMTPIGSFYADKLDVVQQSYENSFPKFPAALKTHKEWYGIECKGYWNSPYAEKSTISLGSDDGSKLYIDDALAINNDGLHSPTTVSLVKTLEKKEYKIKLDYYQGPQTIIQLELKVKPDSAAAPVYMDKMFN
jgi:hypothetical protein